MLIWIRFNQLKITLHDFFKEFTLNFFLLQVAFNHFLIDFKVLNLFSIGNFFYDFDQIDFSLLNQSCEIVLNILYILLWHPKGNPIVTKLWHCVIFLQVRKDLIVSFKDLLNLNKVFRLAKIFKKEFFFDLLIFFNLLLLVFFIFLCYSHLICN